MGKYQNAVVLAALLTAGSAVPGWTQAMPGDQQFTAAAQLVTAKKHPEAAAALEKFLIEFPKHPRALQARIQLGDELMELGKPDLAAQAFRKVVDEKPAAPDLRVTALLGLGRSLVALKEAPKAVEPLQEAFDLTRQDPQLGAPTSVLLGDALIQAGRFAEAAKAYDRVSLWPEYADGPRAYYMVGEAYRLAGNLQEAAFTFRNVADKHWRDPIASQAALRAGDAFLALKKLPDAEAEYRRVLKLYIESPSAPAAQMNLGRVEFLRGNYPNARAAYQAAALVFAQSGVGPEAELRIADTYRAERNADEARKRYRALLESPGWSVRYEARYSLALLALEMREMSEATSHLQKLVDDPAGARWSQLARLRLAEVRAGAGDLLAAVTLLRPVNTGDTEPEIRDEASYVLGNLLFRRGDLAGALTEWDALIQKSPNSPFADRATVGAAQIRLDQKDPAGAVAGAAAALKKDLDPETRALALTTLGRAQLALKQEMAGAASLREVVEKHPMSAVAATAARQLLEYYRDTKQDVAARDLESLIALRFPTAVVADDGALDRAEQALEAGHLDEAQKLFRGVVERRPDRARRIRAQAGLAEAAAGLKKPEEAAQQLTALAAEAPSPAILARAQYRVARAYANTGNPEKALVAYNAARAAGPEPELAPAILLGMGRLLSEHRQLGAPEPLLQEVVDKYPKAAEVPGALYALAWSALERQSLETARPLFQRLVTDYPTHPLAADASFRLGEEEFRAGRFREAADRYRVAADTKTPAAEAAAYKLGWALRELKEPGAAAKAFLVVLERNPKSALGLEARVRAGEAYLQLEQDDQARTQFETALAQAGTDAGNKRLKVQAQVGMAEALLLQGEFEKARDLAEEAALPANGWYGGKAQLVRAEAVFQKDGAKPAAQEFVRAASLFAQFPEIAAEAQFRAGECFEKAGNNKAAVAAWQRVITLYAGSDWANRSREKIDGQRDPNGRATR